MLYFSHIVCWCSFEIFYFNSFLRKKWKRGWDYLLFNLNLHVINNSQLWFSLLLLWFFCLNREVTNSFGFSDQSYNSTNACFNFFPWFSEDFAPIFFHPKESNYPIFFDGTCNSKPVFVFDDDDSIRRCRWPLWYCQHTILLCHIFHLEVYERLFSVHHNRGIYPLLKEMPYLVLHHLVRCIPEEKKITW